MLGRGVLCGPDTQTSDTTDLCAGFFALVCFRSTIPERPMHPDLLHSALQEGNCVRFGMTRAANKHGKHMSGTFRTPPPPAPWWSS